MDHTGNTTPTRKKVIPYVRFETLKHVKNLTLLGDTYPSSPYIGLPFPPPPPLPRGFPKYTLFLLSIKQ